MKTSNMKYNETNVESVKTHISQEKDITYSEKAFVSQESKLTLNLLNLLR